MKARQGYVKFFFLFAGALLFAHVVRFADPGRLWAMFLSLGAWGWLALLLYPLVCIWDVWGWSIVFSGPERSRVRFWELFGIRLAGESLNNVTPVIDVGGEYVKVVLSSRRFSIRKARVLATVVVERTALLLSEIAFWSVMLWPAFLYLPLGRNIKQALGATAVLFIVLAACLVAVQRGGVLKLFSRWTGGVNSSSETLRRMSVSLEEADGEIKAFYSKETKRWLGTLTLHFIGWLAGGVEMYLMLRVLGAPVTLVEAVMLECLMQMVRSASFFVPGNLGTQEGGMALVTQWLGYGPSLGVAASLFKRLRQALWTGLGFLLWLMFERLDSRPGVPEAPKLTETYA